MSAAAAVIILPTVWAVAARKAKPKKLKSKKRKKPGHPRDRLLPQVH